MNLNKKGWKITKLGNQGEVTENFLNLNVKGGELLNWEIEVRGWKIIQI